MKKILSVLMMAVLLCGTVLPFCSYADDTTAKLNCSSVIYPGCTFEVGLFVTGENVRAIQGEITSLYDKNQLELITAVDDEGESVVAACKVSGWYVASGSENLMITPIRMTTKGIDGNNLEFARFRFRVRSSVDIGDTIRISLKNVKIDANTPFIDDLIFTRTVEERPKNTNCNLLSLSCDHPLSPDFSSSVTEYTVQVPHTVDSLEISAQQANELAVYEIGGNEGFVTGENVVTVKVTAESGDIKSYVIRVIKAAPPSTETALSAIEVNEGTLNPAFDPAVTSYSMAVASDITALTLNVPAADEKASVEIIGNENFAVGQNVVTVRVTAEDGVSTAVYTITVERMRPLDTDPYLSALSFGDYPISPAFAPETLEYSVTVPFEVTSPSLLSFTVRAAHVGSAEVSAPEELSEGENKILLLVKAEDGIGEAEYRLTVTRSARILNADATLKSLSCDYGKLTPAFDPEITVYTLVTAPNPGSIAFSAIPNDPVATADTLVFTPAEGTNVKSINCTAENGTVKTYTVIVSVQVEKVERELILTGAPMVGEKLTARVVGSTGSDRSGSYQWYFNNKLQSEIVSDSYTLMPEDKGKTIKVRFVDSEGTLESDSCTVVAATSQVTAETNKAGLIIAICAAFICLAIGTVFGIFFTKSRYR